MLIYATTGTSPTFVSSISAGKILALYDIIDIKTALKKMLSAVRKHLYLTIRVS